ncbi:putative AlkP superfamily pyrophosphatase or phosphodiesterase [Anseongella ginsenosidimutans]|uniref:Putative AlkP superfamily pyrophosphatase or phosphodiesterase n=1 Tax=Anseongella ginsenosidimutans TaxID=496056 RepID=A0A4R3KUN1_9SPHI|nr:nucleotide pyrophosphatase/phosphodiesterase family protein [Anseongella ginsenosidimutans]QEC53479.1 alkaline phosphatase family protein [Anseongella ginsenosidimutans]TCS88375.1 putative AlkP superfamily pyrophosphatase or phosphodiesterase [Anseongella ginsenosidimutans]
MNKTVVIDVVGLTKCFIGRHTPFLEEWASRKNTTVIDPVLPALTTSAQSTYVTGRLPTEHGIVGNGWYDRNDAEIKFWKQSNKLVQAEKIWEKAKKLDPSFTCSKMFWWYNMYSTADYTLTPRPQYRADGRKIPDVYSQPPELRDQMQKELGQFPLFNFWGPNTHIRSSRWIADASMKTDAMYDPTLTLIYLPHMDYNPQRHGPGHPSVMADLEEIDAVCKDLITYYEGRNARVILLSEYGISQVQHAVSLNRLLRKKGLLQVRVENGLELLDPGASRAFALADHQVAHVYVNDTTCMNKVRSLLEDTEGIELILDGEGKQQYGIGHERAGDLVAVAAEGYWFDYYYWMDDSRAPDFARVVDIHRKPGYDPVEMFTNPGIKFLMPLIAWKLLRKKLGFRMLMDIIPLDASLVKGSHGRINVPDQEKPVLITGQPLRGKSGNCQAVEVFDVIWEHLTE